MATGYRGMCSANYFFLYLARGTIEIIFNHFYLILFTPHAILELNLNSLYNILKLVTECKNI